MTRNRGKKDVRQGPGSTCRLLRPSWTARSRTSERAEIPARPCLGRERERRVQLVHGEGFVPSHYSSRASSLTGMQRRVDNLLGLPQLRCHLVRLALLVGYQRPLGLLETRLAHEQRASTPEWSAAVFSDLRSPCLIYRPYPAVPTCRPIADCDTMSLPCLSADAMPATRRARRYCTLGPLADPPQESRSPRICETGGMPHAAPVCAEVISRLGQGPMARQRSRHCIFLSCRAGVVAGDKGSTVSARCWEGAGGSLGGANSGMAALQRQTLLFPEQLVQGGRSAGSCDGDGARR